MSYSKRILFGDHPDDDAARTAIAVAASRTIDAFPCRVPTRRKNRMTASPHWDPFWPSALSSAATELQIETIHVNDQICTRTPGEAVRVKERAEGIRAERIARYYPKFAGR